MPQGKLLEFLEDIGIFMSAGHLSNLLIKNYSDFESEKSEIYLSGLASSPWQHFDQTGARVGGVNHTTNKVNGQTLLNLNAFALPCKFICTLQILLYTSLEGKFF